MKAIIFVSYSRKDVNIVTPIVRLVRTAIAGVPSLTGKLWEFVFQDIDHIDPGDDWEKKIDEAILEMERMFVFWCDHSEQSDQVRREYTLALAQNKMVIPLLLDDTPLPDMLKKINGIDLRTLNLHVPDDPVNFTKLPKPKIDKFVITYKSDTASNPHFGWDIKWHDINDNDEDCVLGIRPRPSPTFLARELIDTFAHHLNMDRLSIYENLIDARIETFEPK